MSEVLAALITGLVGVAGLIVLYISQGRHDAQDKDRRKLDRRLSARDVALAHVRECIDRGAALFSDLPIDTLDLGPIPEGVEKAFGLDYGNFWRSHSQVLVALKALGANDAYRDLLAFGASVSSERRKISSTGGLVHRSMLVEKLARIEKHYIDLKGSEE